MSIAIRRSLLLLACASVAGLALQLTTPTLAGESGDDLLKSGKKLYSQNDEELIIRHFFKDKNRGFFVDVGCYHWKNFSTTYYLEEHLGWRGIGIDALPELEQEYKKNRPDTRFFNYIVTDHSGTIEELHVAGPVSSTSEDWIDRFPAATKQRTIQVPTITLTKLLDENRVSTIDFLSMDIEGGEPAALAGFDIDRFKPKLVCIEKGAAEHREKLMSYFGKHGYERIDKYLEYDNVNWYFTPKSPAKAE